MVSYLSWTFTNDFQKLFKGILYSDLGTNARAEEKQTYMFYIDILEECEIGEISVMCLMLLVTITTSLLVSKVLKMRTPLLKVEILSTYHRMFFLSVTLFTVLSFVTGAEEIPPLGFPHNVTLDFSESSPYSTASTCAIQLMLPSKNATYECYT